MERKTAYQIIAFITIISIIIIGGITTGALWKNRITIKVFHAGSLTLPLERIKARFEQDFANYRPPGSIVVYSVEVHLESAGSVECVRKITELGKKADVLAVADYTLIPGMMMPNYASWYLMFARNRIVIAYTNESRYHDEINSTNWYQILNRTDVRWGFSNPNLDPCGYRTMMVIQLAELKYNNSRIFEDLVESHSAIRSVEVSGQYRIICPEDPKPDPERIKIMAKSVELIALLEEGGLDYAFEYLSVAVQHNLNYIELPKSIDLSDITLEDSLYHKVIVQLIDGVVYGKSIVYGITIPKNAPNRELAEYFVKYVIDEFGRRVFDGMGQPPIIPALAYNYTEVPSMLKPYCVEV